MSKRLVLFSSRAFALLISAISLSGTQCPMLTTPAGNGDNTGDSNLAMFEGPDGFKVHGGAVRAKRLPRFLTVPSRGRISSRSSVETCKGRY